MKIHKIAQEQYFTKDGRPITFDERPFAESNDRRGWVVHHIYAYVDGKEAGYIKLSYIPKDKWDSIFSGNVWKFNTLAHGSYVIPEEMWDKTDEEIQADINKRYSYAAYHVESMRHRLEEEMKVYELYFIDKPIVDFIKTYPEFQRQRIAYALHQYANQWLRNNYGLKLWLSYCRTGDGKCFYDKKLLDVKRYKYPRKMPEGFRRTREYMASGHNWYKRATQQ